MANLENIYPVVANEAVHLILYCCVCVGGEQSIKEGVVVGRGMVAGGMYAEREAKDGGGGGAID